MALTKKSPLKARPLRNAGESVQAELFDEVFDRLLLPWIIAVFLLALAALEWWRYYKASPPAPMLHSVVAAIGVTYAVFQIARVCPRIRRLKLGRDGEKAVGQFLERLRAQGYEVFHDVQADGFNVDHVLIGPAGIFTVETKTYSKPAGREARVHFDGAVLRVDGYVPDRDPVVQAKAQASWLREIVWQSTGKRLPVRPIILFPGWFVEQRTARRRDVGVLEPKTLPGYLDEEEPVLSAADIRLASFHLSRFIRATA